MSSEYPDYVPEHGTPLSIEEVEARLKSMGISEYPEPTLKDALEAVERLQKWDPLKPAKKVRRWYGTSSLWPCRNCPSRVPGSKFQELTQRVEKLEALLDLLINPRESIGD